MSKKQEHSVSLSPELMQKYREGKLSPREMHQVERLLLENPFYEEAVEGLDKMGKDTSLDIHMADLKERLHQRVSGHQKTIPVYRRAWQLAAAVVLLVIGSWVGYHFYSTNSEEQAEQMLSMQNEPAEASEPAPAPLRDEENKKEISQATRETTPTENPASSLVQASGSSASDSISSLEKVEVADEQVTTQGFSDTETLSPLAAQQPDIEAEGDADLQPALAISKVPEENFDQSFRSSQGLKSKAAGAKVYGSGNGPFILRGTVISEEDKSPLPGVNVIIKNTNAGTVTDINGDFKLTIPENQSEVEFSFIGFHATEQTLSPSDSNVTVILTPDMSAQLSEVVVTVQGQQEKKAMSKATQATPLLVEYASYKEYLQKNLQYPQSAKVNNIEGVVSVSFDVTPYGELQNFSVKKSLGYGCNEEAIRLIKEGPAWQPGTEEGKAAIQNVTVKVRFSLKD